MSSSIPTLEEFKEYLSYDPITGIFTWINCTYEKQRKKLVGKPAGKLTKDGLSLIHI